MEEFLEKLPSFVFFVGTLLSWGAQAQQSSYVRKSDYTRYMKMLVGESPLPSGQKVSDRRRDFNLDALRTFFHAELKSMGYQVMIERFDVKRLNHRWLSSGRSRDRLGVNFYVDIPGSKYPNEIVMMGAHYDTTGANMPGANDNATGAAAVLTVAKALSESGFRPERTLRLCLFDAEEEPGLYAGSSIHFDQTDAHNENVKLLVNIDMIGNSPGGFSKLYHDPGLYTGITDFVKRVVAAKNLGFEVHPWGVHYSDQRSAWRHGIPSAGFFEFPTLKDGREGTDYHYYHQRTDTLDKMNLDYATRYTGLLFEVMKAAANTRETWAHKDEAAMRRFSTDPKEELKYGVGGVDPDNYIDTANADTFKYLDRHDLKSKPNHRRCNGESLRKRSA